MSGDGDGGGGGGEGGVSRVVVRVVADAACTPGHAAQEGAVCTARVPDARAKRRD